MAMNQQKRKRKIGLGVIVWLVLALGLLIAFLIKKDDILVTLKKTLKTSRLKLKIEERSKSWLQK